MLKRTYEEKNIGSSHDSDACADDDRMREFRCEDRICRGGDDTGSCGRRAFEKIFRKLKNVVLSVMPGMWKLSGTLGLDDPCLNGRVAQANAVMMPFYEDHFQMNSQWEQYRVDLCAELSGKVVLFVPVKEFLPLIFDKDIKKVIKKLRRASVKFADVM